jgi:hypothetical protein
MLTLASKLLISAMILLQTVATTPNIDQSIREQAILVANTAISFAQKQLATESVSTKLDLQSTLSYSINETMPSAITPKIEIKREKLDDSDKDIISFSEIGDSFYIKTFSLSFYNENNPDITDRYPMGCPNGEIDRDCKALVLTRCDDLRAHFLEFSGTEYPYSCSAFGYSDKDWNGNDLPQRTLQNLSKAIIILPHEAQVDYIEFVGKNTGTVIKTTIY